MKSIKHTLPLFFLPAALALLLALTSCREEPATINITMVPDYSQIVEAINRTDRSLTEKMSLVEAAITGGFADINDARQLLSQALSTMSGTMEEKLSQIETAVKSQTSGLEIKLALIEAAVSGGFADSAAKQSLLISAIESLEGTNKEKLAAIETAIKNQTASLETKLVLIETAVRNGLADEAAKLELLKQAVYALSGTASERLQALKTAVESQGTTLSTALALVETALDNRLADVNEAMELLLGAVNKLDGTAAEKLAAINTAVQDQTSRFETKLALIDAAVKAGFADAAAQEDLLQKAVLTLDGTLKAKLALIETAVNSQTTSLSSKLELIETAVTNGLADEKDAKDLILQAVESLDGTLEQQLTTIAEQISSQTLELWDKLGLIEAALNKGISDDAKALSQIEQALSTSLKDGLDDIKTELNKVNTTLQGHVTAVLRKIAAALTNNGPIDYRPILMAIQQTLKELSGENMLNGHEYVVMGPNGLKWATCNVGADNPWDNGDYFAWGETEPYYSSLNPLVWKTGKEGGYAAASYSIDITDTTLQEQDDAARQNWGGTWRMPTNDELWWLVINTEHKWTDNYNGTGVRGLILTSKVENYNGNQIFLPVAGYWKETQRYEWWTFGYCFYFWSSSTGDDNASAKAMMMEGTAQSMSCSRGDKPRYYGLSVRPVSD